MTNEELMTLNNFLNEDVVLEHANEEVKRIANKINVIVKHNMLVDQFKKQEAELDKEMQELDKK